MARPRSFDEDEVLHAARHQFWSTAVTEKTRRALDGPDAGAYRRLRSHMLAVADATVSTPLRN
jgi:hypothetical protein